VRYRAAPHPDDWEFYHLDRYRDRNENFVPVVHVLLGRLEADALEEAIERLGDLLVELVELRQPLLLKCRVTWKRLQEPGCERSVNPFKEFQKYQTDPIALRQEPIAPSVRQLFHEALRAQFREIIAQGREAVVLG